jgi:hypothetical protein
MHPTGLRILNVPFKIPQLQPSPRALLQTPYLAPTVRRFSAQKQPAAAANTNPKTNSNANSSTNPLKQIWSTMSRPAKIVVVVAFSIMGTAETVFWINVARRKIKGWRTEGEE